MPGIAGIIGPVSPAETDARLGLMVRSMMHEPHHRSGQIAMPELGARIGWVVSAGSYSDCLPIWNRTRDVCLIFVGEHYADQRDLDGLRSRGHEFNPDNATSLLALYEELGTEFLSKLNGLFCGVLLDLREKRAVLFNDRYGVSRVHVHEHAGAVYFASEAKALLSVLPHLRQLDFQGVGEFLSCGCVMGNRTLFSGVTLLPGGSAWRFAASAVSKGLYFRPAEWEAQPALGEAEFHEVFTETWRRLVPRYYRGPERIGLSLTGGVDSRMILAWAPPGNEQRVAYTFNGRYRDCADVRISRQVAAAVALEHQTISVGAEFLARFSELSAKAVYVSDGTMDVTGAVDLYVQQLARQIAPVRVTGTNGGEILRSLVNFKPSNACEGILSCELAGHLSATSASYAEAIRGRRLTFTAFKQSPWLMASKFVLERSLVTLRMPYFDNEFVRLVYQAPASIGVGNGFSRRMIATGNPALGRLGTDRGGSPSAIPGMAWAQRQAREFLFRAEYAYDYGMPQWLAKADRVVAPFHFERLFFGRHKIHHFRVFYRDELSAHVQEVLLDRGTLGRDYLNGSAVARIVTAHLEGRGNHTKEIHNLLTLELIQRTLVEGN